MPTSQKKSPRKNNLVTGIGGVFLRARNPSTLSSWYSRHLGLKITDNVVVFVWRAPRKSDHIGHTVWSLFPSNTNYFPIKKQFMINYRVRNLRNALDRLRGKGVRVEEKIEDSKYGKFGWIYDPEGNKIELWEPPRNYKYPEQGHLME
jgi:predicted enzyme related to lactoylglutathione lyase